MRCPNLCGIVYGLIMINIFIQLEKPFFLREFCMYAKKRECIFLFIKIESDLLYLSDVEVISLLYGMKSITIHFSRHLDSKTVFFPVYMYNNKDV